MSFSVTLDSRATAALKAYPARLRSTVLDGAAKDAADELARRARGYVHSRTGALARSIAVRHAPQRPGQVGWQVTAGAYYALWVELGHGPPRARGRYGRGRGRGGHGRGRATTGRRTPPHRFLTRAVKNDRQGILAVFRQSATRRLAARNW
jgi:hypothetical protein